MHENTFNSIMQCNFERSGVAQAQKYDPDGQGTGMDQGPGDCFGELSLLNDSVRAANVIALSQVHCWSIDRKSFTNLLGSLKDILEQSSARYESLG